MEMVRRSQYGRFILTTREHILRSALQMSEKLAHSTVLDHKCILEIGDYIFSDKSRILYNHLYFSHLPHNYKVLILQNDFFLDIIKHDHFNPRLVEWLSTLVRQRDVKAETYQAYISALLDSPEKIWNHAFRKQISDASRDVLLILYTLGQRIGIVDLEQAFISFHYYRAKKYNQQATPNDFREALQELDGAFLNYLDGRVSYLNPSVREFVASVILSDWEVAEDFFASAIRFKQIVNIWKTSGEMADSTLRLLLISKPDLLSTASLRLLNGPQTRWAKQSNGKVLGTVIDMSDESKIDFLSELSSDLQSTVMLNLAVILADQLCKSWETRQVEFSGVVNLLEKISKNCWFLEHGGTELYFRMLDGMLCELEFARANDWLELLEFSQKKSSKWDSMHQSKLKVAFEKYCEYGIDENINECSGLDEKRELRDSLDQLNEKYDLDLQASIEHLDNNIAAYEEDYDRYEKGSGSSSTPRSLDNVVTDDSIRQMFQTLIKND